MFLKQVNTKCHLSCKDHRQHKKPIMSCVCVLRPVFAFCVLWYVRCQNARHSPKCLEMLGTMLGAGRENVISRGRKHTVC